jgi:allantoicase
MERNFNLEAASFTGLVDLAQAKVGGKALLCSDEFFAGMDNLLKPGRGIFLPDEYTDRGKWMDGWETRRKRVPGYDWCVIELGIPGVIRGVDIDTNHFLGNHPPYASLEAVSIDTAITPDELSKLSWTEVLTKSALKQGSQNVFAVSHPGRWTHIRLNIFPDGGVARLKVFGEARPLWSLVGRGEKVDLAAIENGGLVVAANDMFFGNKNNMIMPGRALNMGDGWETRRRREPGHDWAVVQLGHPGIIEKLEIDTNHYKGNFPDTCWVEGCFAPGALMDTLTHTQFEWMEVLERTKLKADHRHLFEKELKEKGPWTHLRINIAPDGGISRLRAFGTLAEQAHSTEAGGLKLEPEEYQSAKR